MKKLNKFDERRCALPTTLFIIFIINFSIIYSSHGNMLVDPDAYFQYMMAEYVVEQGYIPQIHELAYYPTGRNVWTQDHLLLPYLFAYSYMIIKAFGIEMMEWALIFPAITGALSCIALYLMISKLFGRNVAILSSLLYAISPLPLTRVYSGTIDKEVMYGMFAFAAVYLFLKAWKDGIRIKQPKTLLAPVLSGMLFGMGYTNWSGTGYVGLVIAIAIIFYLTQKQDLEILKSLFIMTIMCMVTMYFIQPSHFGFAFFKNCQNLLFPFFISSIGIISINTSNHLKKRNKSVNPLIIIIIIAFAVSGILIAAGEREFVDSIATRPYNLLFSEKQAQEDVYLATVAESQPTVLFGNGKNIIERVKNGDFYRPLQLTLFILPFSILLMLIKLNKDRANFSYYFAVVWVISGFLAANQGQRYLFFLAPSSVVMVAYIFAYFIETKKREVKEIGDKLKVKLKPKMREDTQRKLSNALAIYYSLVLLLILISGMALNTSIESMKYKGKSLPEPWLASTSWVKDNTEENAIIMFWWDYGYYFQALAERRTVADGGANVPVNKRLAHMFTTPENESIEIIKEFVDYKQTPTYMLVSYEEFGKSSAINHIAQDELWIGTFDVPRTNNAEKDKQTLSEIITKSGITGYHIVNLGDRYKVWFLADGNNPGMKDKLLARLLPFNTGGGQGLKHFKLVYEYQQYIWIYRIV